MMQIKFKEDDKSFNIMAEDERYMVCNRIYTAEESIREAKEWDEREEEYINAYDEKTVEQIKFIDGCFCIYPNGELLSNCLDEIKIIGNIYENKDLLEQ